MLRTLTTPPASETISPEVEAVLVEAVLADAPLLEEVLDPEEVVEEAEQLLRESAPHDYDVLIIGGGPGGYTCALRASQLGARVAIIEQKEIGGVCLNRGCIPAKALLESANVLRLLQHAEEFGIRAQGEYSPDFAAMNARKNAIVSSQREQIETMLARAGVKIINGYAKFIEAHSIEVKQEMNSRVLRAVHVVIATGSRPQRLAVPGCDEDGVLTSEGLLELQTIPEKFIVIGAGAVGVEFAYLFSALGSHVTLLEMAGQIMPAEDEDIALEMARHLEHDGIEIITRAKLQRIERNENLSITYEREGQEHSRFADCVLMATGRTANTESLNLEVAEIEREDGKIKVDEWCETSVGGVHAIGDCIRDVGWAHQAAAEGQMVAERICGYESHVDLSLVPSCYYTSPEVASVGLTLEKAREKNMAAHAGVFHFRANGRAATAGQGEGFVKIVVEENSERIIGCQIIGPRATDLINEALLAIKIGQTVDEMVSTIHTHPAFNEALPEAALMVRGEDSDSGA